MAASTEPPSPNPPGGAADPLALFGPATAAWFRSAFPGPTSAQAQGWASIASGSHTLIHAPTGSGKTLAAFLWCLDRLAQDPRPEPTRTAPGAVRVLYVSPLKALIYDVERNLRAPLAGMRLAAQRLGEPEPRIDVGVRTGDTPADERRSLVRHPPHILITTPESLYLILTSQAAEILRGVEHVIVDEVHALAGTKRGAHLAISLERLEHLTARPPQRIGLSATQRPVETTALFLGGVGPGRAGESREVRIVDVGTRKALELSVRVPVEDMSRPNDAAETAASGAATGPGGEAGEAAGAEHGIWPTIYPRILQLIREHRSTIVFCNSRRLAERLANKLNELAGEDLVRAHHGSLAREQRVQIEEALKAGRLPAIVATSSLELGIDMGAVDLVVQVESPASVASGLQRVGRAGHHVGEASRGVIFPKHRGDLLESAVVTARMHEGAIESTKLPRNPLDVLAQQVVAMAVREPWQADELFETIRRAAPYETLTRDAFEAVLGMLAGAYPSDEFAELKARVVWDRETGRVEGRRDARTVAIISGGTIPDRGLYPVFMVGQAGTPGRRVGELDEEMVYESRAGDVIALGATSWRIEEIRPDRVTVSPAPGQPGKIPFWHGDGLGRPIELGRALGEFVRHLEGDLGGGERGRQRAIRRLMDHHDLDELAAGNVLGYLADEREAAGHLPTDRRIVVERFRDELGDWRIVILTPFGGRVHAPWCLAIEARLGERFAQGIQTLWSDDGIAIRLPETEGAERPGSLADALFPLADEVEDLVVSRLGTSAMFAARFRENAARALLLPRRRPGSRTPLWQQRQRSAGLLAVASQYGSFPIIVETYRECLADLFDLPALREVLGGVERREIEVRDVETAAASPFAGSLLFDYLAAYMYEGDAPLAERRAGALALDRDLLRDLLGQEELRDLIDPAALADLELALQALVTERAARSADALHDLLRRLGDLTTEEAAARVTEPQAAPDWLAELARSRRAIAIRVAGEERWIAIEDAARYRDGLGAALPVGVPAAFLGQTSGALDGMVARWAHSHGPFLATEPARRWGLQAGPVEEALERLLDAGTILRGEFRPGGVAREWCDPDVLRQLRRRSLARLRKEVEPVDQVVLARFLPAWQGVRPVAAGGPGAGGSGAAGGAGGWPGEPALRGEAALERLAEVVDQLAGVPIPASVLERDVLPARIPGYQPRLLDELGALGEVAWVGRGSLGRDDGRIVLYRPGRPILRDLASAAAVEPPSGDLHESLRRRLRERGASFYRELASAATATERDILDALWDLVWAGEVTNDTFAPLRALRWHRPSGERRPRLGRLQTAPPEGAGRWSLIEPEWGVPGGAQSGSGTAESATAGTRSATERLHAFATAMLERHGVLTREAVAAEQIAGGFSGVYPILRAMEESGRIRRGYFVDGLGAAQFALPGAVDRLRAMRETPDEAGARGVYLLAAADPANPYGAALPWPRREESDRRPFQRAAGAYVALVNGAAALYLERGGHSLQTLPAAEDGARAEAAAASLAALVESRRVRELVISRVDGDPVASSRWRAVLEGAGFVPGYRGHVLRPSNRGPVPAGRGLGPETMADESSWRAGQGRSTRRDAHGR